MNLSRRSFFKILAASAAVVAVPSLALGPAKAYSVEEIAEFLAGQEYGVAVTLPGVDVWEKYAEWATEYLLKDAAAHLPKGTVVEIRVCTPFNYGRSQGAAWYTNQWIGLSEPTGGHDLLANRMGGYYSAGSFRV